MFNIKLIYNHKKKYILFNVIFFLLFFLSTTHANIVTSIRPLAFISTAIANGVTNVSVLIPNNISPHNYSLKPSDLKKIKTSELFIWIGGDIENFFKKTIINLSINKQIELIKDPNIIKLLIKKKILNNKLNHKQPYYNYDMHIWLSPKIAMIIAKLIHDKLIKIHFDKKKILDNNLFFFNKQLHNYDIYIKKKMHSIVCKKYYVFHDAYIYFEQYYFLSSLGSFTNSHFIHPGAKKIYKIKRKIIEKKINCIFTEPQIKPAIVKKIIENTNINIGILDPLGSNIKLSINSYIEFLLSISNAFDKCLHKSKEFNKCQRY